MSEPLRIGVLGAARINELSIVGPARATGARLVAVAARDRGRAEAFAAQHGVERVVDGYEQLVNDPEVELVYNPLVNSLHAPWNVAALRAGKHVLTEKPSASSAAEARIARDAAVRSGRTLLEGFHYLYHPAFQRLLELLDSGELGTPERFEADVCMPAPDDDDPRWELDLAGGAVMDLGCYALHANRVIAGRLGGAARLVDATAQERAGHPGVDERLTARLELPSGVEGVARCDMAFDSWRMTCTLRGSAGEATVANFVQPHLDDRVVVSTSAGERVERLGVRSSYTFQLEALAAHLRDGAPAPLDADDAVESMVLVDEAYRAAGLSPRPAALGG